MSFKFIFFLNGKLVLSLYSDKKKIMKIWPLFGKSYKNESMGLFGSERLLAPDLQLPA